MKSVATPDDMVALVGTEIGVSDWVTVDQPMINAFAEVTADHQWIHVDVARAAREMPDGKTIAHGYLILALIPRLINSLYEVRNRKRSINYGLDRVRFIAPVPVGSRVRLRTHLKGADPIKGGYRLRFGNAFEIEGADRPAAVIDNIIAVYA